MTAEDVEEVDDVEEYDEYEIALPGEEEIVIEESQLTEVKFNSTVSGHFSSFTYKMTYFCEHIQ